MLYKRRGFISNGKILKNLLFHQFIYILLQSLYAHNRIIQFIAHTILNRTYFIHPCAITTLPFLSLCFYCEAKDSAYPRLSVPKYNFYTSFPISPFTCLLDPFSASNYNPNLQQRNERFSNFFSVQMLKAKQVHTSQISHEPIIGEQQD